MQYQYTSRNKENGESNVGKFGKVKWNESSEILNSQRYKITIMNSVLQKQIRLKYSLKETYEEAPKPISSLQTMKITFSMLIKMKLL